MAEIDMTKPQPCTKFRGAQTAEWMAKLSEETNEVIQEASMFWDLDEHRGCLDPEAVAATADRLALELTDVVHVCVSWLDAMGYDEKVRGNLHRRVNEKNHERGYF
ncbi:MAG: hypothetical protein ACFNLO_08415 [Selenomonas massiliensis]